MPGPAMPTRELLGLAVVLVALITTSGKSSLLPGDRSSMAGWERPKMGREGRKSTPNKQKVCFGEEARGTRQHRGGMVGWEKEDRSKPSAPGAGCSCHVFGARWSSWRRAREGELRERGSVVALMNRHSHLCPSVNGPCSCCWFLLERLVTSVA